MQRCLYIIFSFSCTCLQLSALAQIAINERKISARRERFCSIVSALCLFLFVPPGYDTTDYTLDFVNATLRWKKQAAADSTVVVYRVFPYRLNSIANRFAYDSIRNFFLAEKAIARNSNANNNSIINFGNLTYNGSFGRSLSVGNTQDAVFNSQLNLQINGLIGDSIQIAAAITDNNIPIQPDGTTQQLNEFDRILLQFKKRNWEINLGDIDLRRNNAYFLKFYKRLQGISYRSNFTTSTKM